MNHRKGGRTYHLYGRKEHTRPLEFVKVVQGTNRGDERAELLREVSGEWVELVAFPAEAIMEVIPGADEND